MRILLVIFMTLSFPYFGTSQTNRKYYKILSEISQGIQVSTDEVNGGTILVFKITSQRDFTINESDTMTIIFTDESKSHIVCDRPSSYHASMGGSGIYYNAVYFRIDDKQKELLKSQKLKTITFSRFVFDEIKKGNSDAIAKSIAWFFK